MKLGTLGEHGDRHGNADAAAQIPGDVDQRGSLVGLLRGKPAYDAVVIGTKRNGRPIIW
jgi:hypothetical protein